MYKEFVSPEKTLPANLDIPLSDRIKYMEEVVLSFVAKYSLPFSPTRNIVEIAKEMMCDPKAVSKLKVARQTRSYKMRYGLAKCAKNR